MRRKYLNYMLKLRIFSPEENITILQPCFINISIYCSNQGDFPSPCKPYHADTPLPRQDHLLQCRWAQPGRQLNFPKHPQKCVIIFHLVLEQSVSYYLEYSQKRQLTKTIYVSQLHRNKIMSKILLKSFSYECCTVLK